MKYRYFFELDKDEQNDLRVEYRSKYREHYNYSIKLFIVYVITGILFLLGIPLLLLIDKMLGMILMTISFILLSIDLYFLYRSNDRFVRFLNKKLIKYKRDN